MSKGMLCGPFLPPMVLYCFGTVNFGVARLDRLAVSPQCGFASVDTGNPVTPEAQEAKLRLVIELARDVWGEA